ncbi:hypothetical protein C8R43DRAFT_1137540 [Mycena crocata]|nr:hypothetical protein C8R43DRAFT_1137540 [Mycena crocata]
MLYEYDIHGDTIMQDVFTPAADTVMVHLVDGLSNHFSCVSLVVPSVHRVPDDVLYELFMFLAGEPSFTNCDFTVLLSHVCRDWRSIIVRAPLLWKFITMHSSGSCKDHSATVESFLSRSQDQSITFGLFLRKTPLSTSPFAKALRKHAPRVRSLLVLASNFPSLASHLVDLSSLSLTSLQHHEATVRSGRANTPGTFIAVSRPSFPGSLNIPIFAPTSVPTWPSHLDITTLSFMYSSLKLFDIFRFIEMSQSTLQNLKLYFQGRHNVVTPSHWDLIDGPCIDLPELRSMDLGYHDPLSLVPFLHRVRLLALESLSLHNYSICRAADTPHAVQFQLQVPLPHGVGPTDHLFSTLLSAIHSPVLLRSLSFTGQYIPDDDIEIIEEVFDLLGPQLRTLYLADCTPQFLDVLAECMLYHHTRWRLERLTARGMDNDDLLVCLRSREANQYPRLKELSLAPYTRPPTREVLQQFAEVINIES